MNEIEIFDVYDNLPEYLAFKLFQTKEISNDTIASVLGYDVAKDYKDWIAWLKPNAPYGDIDKLTNDELAYMFGEWEKNTTKQP